MEKEDNLMFHPDPEVQQIKGQLQLANRYLTTAPKKKQLAIDSSSASPKGGWFSHVSGCNPCRRHWHPTLTFSPGKHRSSWFHGWEPYQSCFCAVTKRVLWAGQGARGRAPSVTVDGSAEDDPEDHEQAKPCHKPFFCEHPCAAIVFLLYLQVVAEVEVHRHPRWSGRTQLFPSKPAMGTLPTLSCGHLRSQQWPVRTSRSHLKIHPCLPSHEARQHLAPDRDFKGPIGLLRLRRSSCCCPGSSSNTPLRAGPGAPGLI